MADQRAQTSEWEPHRTTRWTHGSDSESDNGTGSNAKDERPYLHSLAADPHLTDAANSPVREQVMQHLQQTHGNRAVQRLLGGASTLPSAPTVSIQRRSEEPWLGDSPTLGAVIDTLGGVAGGPAVGTPSWVQTLNKHATGFEKDPLAEGIQAVQTDVVGVLPGIGDAAGVASLGHDTINAVISPMVGDWEAASQASSDVSLDALGLVPGVGDALGWGQLGADAYATAGRGVAEFASGGTSASPEVAERIRKENPLSGEMFNRGLQAIPPGLFLPAGASLLAPFLSGL